MKHRVFREVTKSLLAIVALVALVVGLPWVLAANRGWPLPTEVPSLDAVSQALRGASISDEILLNALACLCWVAWLLLAASVLAEVVAWARGRAARSIIGTGLFQPVARRLVVSATLLVGTLRSAPVADATLVRPTPVTVTAARPEPTPVQEAVAPDRLTCVVGPRDSLWRIAERHLGDPFRWREIYELNQGRTYADGRTFRDADLIHPGWDLHLPPDAVGAVSASPPSLSSSPHVDESSVSPPSPASTNERTVSTASVADDVDVAPDDDDEANSFPVPVAIAGATLLAAGVVRLVSDLRRRQRRLRPMGHAMPGPSADALHAERALRAASADDAADRVDLALRALGAQLAQSPVAEHARVEAVRVDGDAIEVLLDQAVSEVPGLFSHDHGRVWTLPGAVSSIDLAVEADQRGCLVPALVSIGRVDGADVLIDLELTEPLRVHGAADEVAHVLWSMALDLAVHAWADDVRIVTCGLPDDGLAAVDRVEVSDDLAATVDDVERAATGIERALDAQHLSSTWHGRLANVGDGWTPTVVMIGPNVDAGVSAEMVARLQGLTSVGVVVYEHEDPRPGGGRALLVKGTDVALLPLGLVLRSSALPPDLAAATGDLIATSASSQPGLPLVPSEPDESVIDLRERTDPDSGFPSTGVLVRIMGRVEIEGGRRSIDRRRVTEFVTLLALHPRGLTDDQIKSALWLDQEPSTNAFNQIVSRARVALGLDVDGNPHVAFVDECLYKPGPYLTTDWSLLEAAWSRATTTRSSDALDELRAALDLVQGLPFEGTKGYEWAYERGIPSRIEAVIDEARELVEQAVSAAG